MCRRLTGVEMLLRFTRCKKRTLPVGVTRTKIHTSYWSGCGDASLDFIRALKSWGSQSRENCVLAKTLVLSALWIRFWNPLVEIGFWFPFFRWSFGIDMSCRLGWYAAWDSLCNPRTFFGVSGTSWEAGFSTRQFWSMMPVNLVLHHLASLHQHHLLSWFELFGSSAGTILHPLWCESAEAGFSCVEDRVLVEILASTGVSLHFLL